MEVQITNKALEQIMNLPTINKKAITKWDKNQEKVKKIYNKVEWTEVFSLDHSIMEWLKPRLIELKKAWENHIDLEYKPQKKRYNELIELITLSDYILEEKWWEEIPRPVNSTSLNDMFITKIDENGNKYTTIKESTPEEREYYDKLMELELKSKNRYIKLLSKNFWQLGY